MIDSKREHLMFNISLRTAVIGAFAGGLLLSTAHSEEYQKGKETYQTICALCHEVGTGPDLMGRKLPATFITYIARDGFRAMPAFPYSHIDEATLLETAKYIETSKPRETPVSERYK